MNPSAALLTALRVCSEQSNGRAVTVTKKLRGEDHRVRTDGEIPADEKLVCRIIDAPPPATQPSFILSKR